MKKTSQTHENTRKFLLPYELKPHLLNFTKHLSGKGYTPLSVKGYVDSISHLGAWLNKQGISLKDVNSKTINQFARHRCCCPGARKKPSVSKKYVNRVQRFIIYLHQQGIIHDNFTFSIRSLPLSIIQFSEFLHDISGQAQSRQGQVQDIGKGAAAFRRGGRRNWHAAGNETIQAQDQEEEFPGAGCRCCVVECGVLVPDVQELFLV